MDRLAFYPRRSRKFLKFAPGSPYALGIFGKFAVKRSSRSEVFCKNVFLKNSPNFTGKYLRQSLFFNKVAGVRFFEHLFL